MLSSQHNKRHLEEVMDQPTLCQPSGGSWVLGPAVAVPRRSVRVGAHDRNQPGEGLHATHSSLSIPPAVQLADPPPVDGGTPPRRAEEPATEVLSDGTKARPFRLYSPFMRLSYAALPEP